MVQKVIHRSLVPALVMIMSIGVTACGMPDGDITCTPPPQITSAPPTSAIVGQQYVYNADASYLCGMWSICNNIVGLQLPPGAGIDDVCGCVTWTPTTNQANTNVRFVIATGTDDCGDRATQSWTVHVYAAPL